MRKSMPKKSAVAIAIAQETEKEQSELLQEYGKLSEKCDHVLEKIAKRKKAKQNRKA